METNGAATTRRRAAKALAAMAACSLLASCASMVGPREVKLPLYKLQAGMERRFPLDNRMLELFDVHLSRPQLALLPERDRVALTVQAEVAPSFLGKSWSASLALSGRLYVDPSRHGIFMADPRVDQLELGGAGGSYQRQLTKIADLVLDEVVRDLPLYSFRMEDLRYAGVQFVPTRITTRSDALVITLEPAKDGNSY
jgi:hypothetical protein